MLETVKYLIGSVGSSGYGSKSTAEEVTKASPDLRPITAIITGATSGIGAETARVLAMRGARLILPARNPKAAEETKARITEEFPDAEIIVKALDLSSLASVRSFVSEFESLNLPLNLLINNAGKFSYEYALSEDGIEMTFATNYLEATGIQGRIVNVSSSIHSWFSGDGIRYLEMITKEKAYYDPTRAYALSKLANVLHAKELAEQLKETWDAFGFVQAVQVESLLRFGMFTVSFLKKMKANVTINCVHPGIVRTRLTRDREGFMTDLVFFLASKLLKTIPQAAATTCYVATHPRLLNVSGKYFADCNEASPFKLGLNPLAAEQLWSASEAMTSLENKRST